MTRISKYPALDKGRSVTLVESCLRICRARTQLLEKPIDHLLLFKESSLDVTWLKIKKKKPPLVNKWLEK